jgi:beta-aspartyl-dipeptidase (metallo-type)
MLKLIKNVHVYAPENLGRKDVLLIGDKIGAIEGEILSSLMERVNSWFRGS